MSSPYEPQDRHARAAAAFTLALALVLCVLALLSTSCAHCPPCEPEVRIQRVEVPVPVYPDIQPLPPLALPEWPAMPPESASAEEWKGWYAAMAATARERAKLLKERVHALENIMAVIAGGGETDGSETEDQ